MLSFSILSNSEAMLIDCGVLKKMMHSVLYIISVNAVDNIISEWYAVKQHRFAEHKSPQAVKLTPACAFMELFSGARKTLPLSGARYPISLVAYSRSDYDGWRWWTTWFPDEEMRPAPELGLEIDAFQSQLLTLPEFKTLWAMERMCSCMPSRQRSPRNLICMRKRRIFISGSA